MHTHTHTRTHARTHTQHARSFTSGMLCRTWKNALLGEKVIEGLEEKSAELSKEKQDYIGKWDTILAPDHSHLKDRTPSRWTF